MIIIDDKLVNFREAVEFVKEAARGSGYKYEVMKFKDILITVSVDSNIDDLAVIYNLRADAQKYEDY